jgi:hypothetical protein
MRHSNSRPIRKTLAYSKMLDMHKNELKTRFLQENGFFTLFLLFLMMELFHSNYFFLSTFSSNLFFQLFLLTTPLPPFIKGERKS